jgi:thiamine biosynthesis lipoprotein
MNVFRSMGCEVVLPPGVPPWDVRRLFDERDRRFSRFIESSELNRLNAAPRGVAVVSEDLASMLSLAIDAARATDGLVTPAVGGALLAAGYDRDFSLLSPDSSPVEPAVVPSVDAMVLRGRVLLRVEPLVLDLNGVVKGRTVDDALALLGGDGYVSAGGDLACRGGVSVALPGGDAVQVVEGGLATSGTDRRRWRRVGVLQHHLIDPGTGRPAVSPWEQVTVSGRTCLGADVAAKAAFLLGGDGPDWLDENRLPGRFLTADGETVTNASWRRSLREHACT